MAGRVVTQDEALEFRRLYVDEAMGAAKIAAKFNRKDSTVLRQLRRMGVPIRGRGHPRGVGRTRHLPGTRHGMTGHPLYAEWMGVMQRCLAPDHPSYKNYGGRGIEIHPEWRDARIYIEYVESVLGPKPGPDYTINRIDNDGNYVPGNIEWADWATQIRNRDLSRNA